MDAVEVFVVDEDDHISELRAYWDMSRARTRISAIRFFGTPLGERVVRRYVVAADGVKCCRLSLTHRFRPQSISDER